MSEWKDVLNLDKDGPSSYQGPSWMGDNYSWLKELKLGQIILPGSHDAGMFEAHNCTFFACADNTVTQFHKIRQQLELGIRYFDIRPVVKNSKFVCGHVNLCPDPIGWQGAFGEGIEDIVNAVNDFTGKHNGELVVLHIHDFCGFDADRSFADFTNEQWTQLYTTLSKLNGLFKDPHASKARVVAHKIVAGPGLGIGGDRHTGTAYLPARKYGDIVPANQSRVVCVMARGEHRMGTFEGQGFYPSSHWYDKSESRFITSPQSDLDATLTALLHQIPAFTAIGGIINLYDKLKNYYTSGQFKKTDSILEASKSSNPGKILGIADIQRRWSLLAREPIIEADGINDVSIAVACVKWAFLTKRVQDKLTGLDVPAKSAKVAELNKYAESIDTSAWRKVFAFMDPKVDIIDLPWIT